MPPAPPGNLRGALWVGLTPMGLGTWAGAWKAALTTSAESPAFLEIKLLRGSSKS